MAQYVLVHGGDRDGSLWKDVARDLEIQGHQVFCPSMTSVTKASLLQNIEEIISVIDLHQGREIILVGHSYGAMVITGVNDRIPDKIAALIFVDSVVPVSGQSLYGQLKLMGFDYLSFGLTSDRACLDPLSFDAEKLAQKPKIYIHALQSEFLEPLRLIYQKVAEKPSPEWTVFSLEAKHGCMFTHSRELAIIFAGATLII